MWSEVGKNYLIQIDDAKANKHIVKLMTKNGAKIFIEPFSAKEKRHVFKMNFETLTKAKKFASNNKIQYIK